MDGFTASSVPVRAITSMCAARSATIGRQRLLGFALMPMRRLLPLLLTFLVGLTVGGYLFARSLPRSFLALNSCGDQCLRPNDLLGLLASAGIQRTPNWLPFVVAESNECVAVRNPRPEAKYDIVFLPKRDVRNVLELGPADVPFLLGCLALAREQVRKDGIKDYRLVTNGPGRQQVTYFHFHIVAGGLRASPSLT
jgi:hypothetical protein